MSRPRDVHYVQLSDDLVEFDSHTDTFVIRIYNKSRDRHMFTRLEPDELAKLASKSCELLANYLSES
jgi:hypothetical protein